MLGKEQKPKRVGRVRLSTWVNGLPRLHDVRLLLVEAQSHRGSLCELVLKTNKGAYLLSCQTDNLSVDPCWTLYDSEDGSQQLWSYMDSNLEMLTDVIAMTISDGSSKVDLKSLGLAPISPPPVPGAGSTTSARSATGAGSEPHSWSNSAAQTTTSEAWPNQNQNAMAQPAGQGGWTNQVSQLAQPGVWQNPPQPAAQQAARTDSGQAPGPLGGWQNQTQPPPLPGGWQNQTQPPAVPGGWQNQIQPPAVPGGWQNQIQPSAVPGGWQNQIQPAAVPGGWQNQIQPPAVPGEWQNQIQQSGQAEPGGWTNPGQQPAMPGNWPNQLQQPAAPAAPRNSDSVWKQASAGRVDGESASAKLGAGRPAVGGSYEPGDCKVLSFLEQNKQLTIGELVFNSNLPLSCVDAAMRLQELVCKNTLDERAAYEAIKLVATNRGVLDDNIITGARLRSSENPDELARKAATVLQQAGLLTEQDIARAQETAVNGGIDLATAIVSGGKIDRLLLENAQKCHAYITKGSLRSDQAIIALHYCSRMRAPLDDALSDLSISVT